MAVRDALRTINKVRTDFRKKIFTLNRVCYNDASDIARSNKAMNNQNIRRKGIMV